MAVGKQKQIFTERALARAVRGVVRAGLVPVAAEVNRDGVIVVRVAPVEQQPSKDQAA
jgi:hypothetical protein